MQPKLANIIEATAFVPEDDRIYSDCPHATTTIIINRYVNDNVAYTNCEALAAEFEVHCNVDFPMNAEGPVNWYLCVKHDRDPTTVAVSAHQHLYIDKFQEMGHGTVQPIAYTISEKGLLYRQRTRRAGSNSQREARQRILSSGWQFHLSASTHLSRNILGSFGTKQIHDSTRPNTPGDKQETSALPQRAQECHSMMLRFRLHRRIIARHDMWIANASFANTIPHRHSSVGYGLTRNVERVLKDFR